MALCLLGGDRTAPGPGQWLEDTQDSNERQTLPCQAPRRHGARPDTARLGLGRSSGWHADSQSRALRRVGYLPEERGLFQRARVIDALRYLGRLKGLEAKAAERRAEDMLRRVDLADSARATVQGLSRGMTQLIQFSGALLHQPDLIILDEPFAGLDPLNVELMKEIIREEQARGASIIFSTHIMSDVEELCERVLLIDAGVTLLYGSLMELKRSRGTRTVKVAAGRRPESVAGVLEPVAVNGHFEYRLASGSEPQAILRSFLDAQIPVERFEVALPTLNEIFIEEVRRARSRG